MRQQSEICENRKAAVRSLVPAALLPTRWRSQANRRTPRHKILNPANCPRVATAFSRTPRRQFAQILPTLPTLMLIVIIVCNHLWNGSLRQGCLGHLNLNGGILIMYRCGGQPKLG